MLQQKSGKFNQGAFGFTSYTFVLHATKENKGEPV
jgi:hypothetical protein